MHDIGKERFQAAMIKHFEKEEVRAALTGPCFEVRTMEKATMSHNSEADVEANNKAERDTFNATWDAAFKAGQQTLAAELVEAWAEVERLKKAVPEHLMQPYWDCPKCNFRHHQTIGATCVNCNERTWPLPYVEPFATTQGIGAEVLRLAAVVAQNYEIAPAAIYGAYQSMSDGTKSFLEGLKDAHAPQGGGTASDNLTP